MTTRQPTMMKNSQKVKRMKRREIVKRLTQARVYQFLMGRSLESRPCTPMVPAWWSSARTPQANHRHANCRQAISNFARLWNPERWKSPRKESRNKKRWWNWVQKFLELYKSIRHIIYVFHLDHSQTWISVTLCTFRFTILKNWWCRWRKKLSRCSLSLVPV